ncbi:hypothetical protein ACE38V_04600 [Cytobacillus sp. Hz8]|uniref:hypothetical protein n=1 Tax=Cytobacillus sp. Hz8 TaxID=3347168 RepID=UPI0035E101CE
MYRFLINGEEWILRFSRHLFMDSEMKKEVADSTMRMKKQLHLYGHGDSFLIFHEMLGALIFNIEKIPSLILTLSNIIAKEHWYTQERENIPLFSKK